MNETIYYGDWQLDVTSKNTIVVSNLGESREYDLADIVEVNQDEDMSEYVYLKHKDGAYTQVKFEDSEFLVIDLFDKEGNHLTEIGAHVFGDDDDDYEDDDYDDEEE